MTTWQTFTEGSVTIIWAVSCSAAPRLLAAGVPPAATYCAAGLYVAAPVASVLIPASAVLSAWSKSAP